MAEPGSALVVFAAGSLRPAFDVLAAGVAGGVELAYANARDLAERITAGEAADVFASASPADPHRLCAAGLVDEPRPFATNRLVVAVPAASGAEDVGVLARPGARVVIEVEGIPLGDYTRELLARLDEMEDAGFSERVLRNVVSEEQTVDHVAARLLAGEADAAVLYVTDVIARPGALRAIEPPPAARVEAMCVACVVTATADRGRAVAWVDGLTAPAGREIMRRAGFGPIAG